MTVVWDENAWKHYLWWQEQDRTVLRRINALIQEVQRDGSQEGIGKPERLGYGLHDDWFRRITQEHRLVYKVTDNTVRIAMCRYHCHA